MRYAIECNEQEFLCVTKHYKWELFVKEDLKKGNHVIYINNDKPDGWDDCKRVRPNTISFESWALVKNVKLGIPNKTLKLTSTYTADVNYNTKMVQVGCQSISFSKVEELYKLIVEINK